MSEKDTGFDKVVFHRDDGGDLSIGFGYVVFVGETPWLACSRAEAETRAPGTLQQLDPRLLETRESHEAGRRRYLYRGALQAPRR